jgi:hypothetical protein
MSKAHEWPNRRHDVIFVMVALAVCLGVLRVAGVIDLAYQAVAHCYVGGLFGFAIAGTAPMRWWCLFLAIALTALETAAFLYTRF